MTAPDEPEPVAQRAQLTVADALALPVLRDALPRVAAGAGGLDRRLRWVHAGEVRNIADLLLGGELLLTTGMGVGRRAREQRAFVADLAQRGVAALAIELGTVFEELPAALVQAAEQHELPLIALHREVRFVAVTEAVHVELVNAQHALLQRADALQRELTRAIVDDGSIPDVLATLAERIDNPVLLESDDERLLFHAAPPGGRADVRGAHAASGPWPGAAAAAVELGAHDKPWRLVALPLERPLDAFAALALERAAGVMSLALLRARHERELLARSRGDLLADAAEGRVAPADVARRAGALGWATPEDAVLLPLVADLESARTAPEEAWSLAVRDIEAELERHGISALLGTRPPAGALLVLARVRDGRRRADVADAAAAAIRSAGERRLGAGRATVVAAAVVGWSDVGELLRVCAEAVQAAARLAPAPWHDVRAIELDRLLWRWRDDRELGAFVRRTLGPLLAHEGARHDPLVTLEALCAHGGRKAEAARVLFVNRQALYHRIAHIEALLGVDLGDPNVLTTLGLALRARHFVDAGAL